MKTEKSRSSNSKWVIIISILIVFSIISLIIAGVLSLFLAPSSISTGDGNVAVIKINGPITVENNEGFMSKDVASSTTIVSLIEAASKNPKIKALLFEINSPGGSPVASDEIANAIKKENKTSVALIREVGASGAYWVASSTDYIVANRMSITGSIGVYSSMFDFSGFMNDYNITFNLIKAGKYKGIGSPYKELTPEERYQVQKRINKIHKFFIQEVADNRNMTYESVEKLATGIWYLGVEAKDLGLIDKLGGKAEAIKYIETKLNITADLVPYEFKTSIIDSLFSVSSNGFYSMGKGIGDSIKEKDVGIRV